ncbi:hypothetical protein B296_00042778, partial [Ensete ventricosum]
RVEFRSIFCAPSQKFEILPISNVLSHGKSYEHGFMKKRDGHKLCAKSRSEWGFNQFFVYHLGNSKFGHSRCISPLEVVQARFREKM